MGNKNDLYLKQEVKKEDAAKYAKSVNGVYTCVSALDSNSTGINELFDTVALSLLNNEGKDSVVEETDKSKNSDNKKDNNKEFTLKKEEQKEKTSKKKKCC